MVYIVKDLLIGIVPPDEEGSDAAKRLPYWIAGHWQGPSWLWITLYTWPWPFLCPPLSVAGPAATPPGGDPASIALLLATLKMQLKDAIAELAREERKPGASFPFRTRGQTEAAEKQLKHALDEVDREEHTITRKQMEAAEKQLKHALDEVDREEHIITRERLLPQTIEQLEHLERKLTQAQTELKRLKSELQ